MARYNPDLMELDSDATGTERVAGPRNDTTAISDADARAASLAAAQSLTMIPYAKLDKDVRAAMSSEEKAAYDKAIREEKETLEAESRALSNAMFDFTNRPTAPPPDSIAGSDYIYYYSWIGGRTNGEWKLYRAFNNPENVAKYGSRAIGGATQGTSDNIVGANSLVVQPQPITDNEGNVTGFTDNEGNITAFTDNDGAVTGFTDPNIIGYNGTYGAKSIVGQIYTAPDGKIFTDLEDYNNYIDIINQEAKTAAGKSAYDILFEEFKRYGLESLAEEVKGYIVEGLSKTEFSLRLQQTSGYQKRFSANKARIDKGLSALSAAEYIGIEDQYQDTMRRYGLPESYYTKGFLGVQEGFTKLIENDVSNVELEDRIMTAQKRVINTNPEVSLALKQFYPDITNSDILAYSLDPKNAIENIKRKVTSAEIGGAAIQAGLQTGLSKAEQLQSYGVTKESAQQGYGVIAGGLQRGSQLASMYGESPYTQTTAEQEVFNIPGAQEARKQRQKITGIEKATFGGQTGITSSALTRDRAGGY